MGQLGWKQLLPKVPFPLTLSLQCCNIQRLQLVLSLACIESTHCSEHPRTQRFHKGTGITPTWPTWWEQASCREVSGPAQSRDYGRLDCHLTCTQSQTLRPLLLPRMQANGHALQFPEWCIYKSLSVEKWTDTEKTLLSQESQWKEAKGITCNGPPQNNSKRHITPYSGLLWRLLLRIKNVLYFTCDEGVCVFCHAYTE